ncbi:MAG: hypothetical protein WCE48_09720 [Steroidobacteraceae bacterium]
MTAATLHSDPDAAQVRLQAWRSRRPRPEEWSALEAILGFDEFLIHARQPPFARWLEGVGTDPALHEIDRGMRAACRRDCELMAAWYAPQWQRPLARLAGIIELPLLGPLLRGESAAPWVLDDPLWHSIVESDPAQRSRLATGFDLGAAGTEDLFARWVQAWLAGLPPGSKALADGFAHVSRAVFAQRTATATNARERAKPVASLSERLAPLFRRNAGSPLAMVCEFVAVVLDLQRLRSGLVRRALARRAATVPA